MKHPFSLIVAATLLSGSSALAQTDRELATRQELLTQASGLSDQSNHADALAVAKRAAAIKMTPSLRLFIAREQAALGQLAEAYGNGRQCAVEAEAATQLNQRDRILADCKALEESLAKRVGRLTVRLPKPLPSGVNLTISGEPVNAALIGEPYVVTPGKVTILVGATGYLPYRREVEINEGGADVIDAQLAPELVPSCASPRVSVGGACVDACAEGRLRRPEDAPQCCWPGQAWDPATSACTGIRQCADGLVLQGTECVVRQPPVRPSTSRLAPLLLGGAGVTVGLVATVVWFSGDSKYSTLKSQCTGPGGCSTATYNSGSSAIRADDAIGITGWAIGGGLFASGALWYLLGAPKESPPVRVSVEPGTRSLLLTGAF